MNCKKCGKIIDDDSKFCIYCGFNQVDQSNYSKGNLEPYSKDGQYGYKDKDSRDIIIPPKYAYAGSFKENRAVVGLNDKYSIIDQYGKELTPFKYDYISDFENGFAKVKRNEKWTFLNVDNNEITAFKYNSVESFINGLAKVKIDNNYALINQNGNQITEYYYDSISDFILINEKGVQLSEFDTHSHFDSIDLIAIVKRNQKFGLINSFGKEILLCEYDSIGTFTLGFAKISKRGRFGLVDLSGNKVLPCEYDNIDAFSKGIAKISKSNKYGFINSLGEFIITCQYDRVNVLANNSIAAKLNNTWVCFDKAGKDITKSDDDFRRFQKRKLQKKNIFWFLLVIIILSVIAVYDYNTNNIGAVRKIQVAIVGEDEMDWRDAKDNLAISGIIAMETYLRSHPNGKYASEAKNIIEQIEWKNAEILNTSESYNTFLGKYSEGKFASIAQNNLEQITWEKIVKSNFRDNYENYTHDFPSGKHIAEANEYLAWGKAKNLDNIQSYEEYLINYPNGKNMQTAIDALLIKCKCETCNGTGKCHQCNGSGIFGQTQKLVYDPCPNINRLFHGQHCKLCGGSGIIKRFILVDAQCNECNGSGKCNICKGLGKIQNEWLNTWYAKKINCQNCSGTGYIYENIYNLKEPCPVCNLIINKKY